MDKLLWDNNIAIQARQQRTITTLFSPITLHASSQLTATQMNSWPGHCKGITIVQAIAICHAHRPEPCGPRSHQACHRKFRFRTSGACLENIAIQILLYADDIVLIF